MPLAPPRAACGTARDARGRDAGCSAVEVFLPRGLCQLTLAHKTPEPPSLGSSGSQHRRQDTDLPALIPGQRNPRLCQRGGSSPASLAGRRRCRWGCLCRMGLEEVQDIRGAQPSPAALLESPQERWIKAFRAPHGPAELPRHPPPPLQPSPKPGLGADVPGLAVLPAPVLHPWGSPEVDGCGYEKAQPRAVAAPMVKTATCSKGSVACGFSDATKQIGPGMVSE